MNNSNKEAANESAHARSSFTFACSHCGQRLEAEPDMAGIELNCPTCALPITVPKPFTFACPHCGQHLNATPDMAGTIVDCSKCGMAVAVPQPASSNPQPASCKAERHSPPPIIASGKRRVGFCGKIKRSRLIIGVAAVLITAVSLTVTMNSINTIKEITPSVPRSNTTKTLTIQEQKAIGKVLYSIATVEEKKMKFTKNLGGTTGGASSEILVAGAVSLVADNIGKLDGWYDCPIEFQKAIKRVYAALGKAAISEVVEKYGRSAVMDTLRQHNADSNYIQCYMKAMNDGAASIARELKKAQAEMADCFSKYGLDGNNLVNLAVEEFSQKKQEEAAMAILVQMAENQRRQQAEQWNAWGREGLGGFSTQGNDSRLSDMQYQLNVQQQRIQQLQQEQARQQQEQARQQQEQARLQQRQAWREREKANAPMVKCTSCQGGFDMVGRPCRQCGTVGYIRDPRY